MLGQQEIQNKPWGFTILGLRRFPQRKMFSSHQDGTQKASAFIYIYRKHFSSFCSTRLSPRWGRVWKRWNWEEEKDRGTERNLKEGCDIGLGTVRCTRIAQVGWDGGWDGMRCRILYSSAFRTPLSSSIKCCVFSAPKVVSPCLSHLISFQSAFIMINHSSPRNSSLSPFS